MAEMARGRRIRLKLHGESIGSKLLLMGPELRDSQASGVESHHAHGRHRKRQIVGHPADSRQVWSSDFALGLTDRSFQRRVKESRSEERICITTLLAVGCSEGLGDPSPPRSSQ